MKFLGFSVLNFSYFSKNFLCLSNPLTLTNFNSSNNLNYFINNFFLYNTFSLKPSYLVFLSFYYKNQTNLNFYKNKKFFVRSFLKHGSFLKIYNYLSKASSYFFFFFKTNYFFNTSGYSYYNFIKSYLTSNNGFFLNLNLCFWWLLNFLDINFWLVCSLSPKIKGKSEEKYVTSIKSASSFSKKRKMTYKLFYLETLNAPAKNVCSRLVYTLSDMFFNYKLSSLYKKKLVVYKKMFN